MADGAPLASTVLCLSHWPVSPTPPALAHDLSAGSAFRYLRSRRRWPPAECVTTDHYDQDGLVTAFALSRPAEALAREDRLVAVAAAGDFAVAPSPAPARVAFALASLGQQGDGAGASPLDGSIHLRALEVLAEWVDEPERCRTRWEEEEAFVDGSEAALSSGRLALAERPELDLAVLSSSGADWPWRQHWEFTHRAEGPVHPVALHRRTERSRVICLTPPRYELRFRYEGWVRLASRRVAPRLDLEPLADELTSLEPGPIRWAFNGASALVARLGPVGGGSDLGPQAVLDAVTRALGTASPGWDPYRPGGRARTGAGG